MAATVCQVVLVAAMALVTQLALVMHHSWSSWWRQRPGPRPRGPSTAEESDSMACVIPQFPGAPHIPGPGQMMLHLGPEFRVTVPSSCILFQELGGLGTEFRVWAKGGLGCCRWWGLSVGGVLIRRLEGMCQGWSGCQGR